MHLRAYKYDTRKKGIGLQGDPAKVNGNFWLTRDRANLTPGVAG